MGIVEIPVTMIISLLTYVLQAHPIILPGLCALAVSLAIHFIGGPLSAGNSGIRKKIECTVVLLCGFGVLVIIFAAMVEFLLQNTFIIT